MQKTEEFEIDWKGKKEKVIILQMGYAVKCDFRELFIETQMIGKVPKIMIHPFRMKISGLQKCVVEAPFKTDEASLNDIDNIGPEEEKALDFVWEKIQKLNRLGDEDKKN